MRRVVLVLLCVLLLPASARAWTWPVDGPVVRAFNFDRSHPYAGGQHRGIDIAAPEGTPVRAPADGTVTFAGSVPSSGKTVSIETPFGYTATLLHLGSISVARGTPVTEGSIVATAGSESLVYFGLRATDQPQGYVDPLAFLPARATPETVGAPQASSAAAAEPAAAPAATPPGAASSSGQGGETPAPVETSGAVPQPTASEAPATQEAPPSTPESSATSDPAATSPGPSADIGTSTRRRTRSLRRQDPLPSRGPPLARKPRRRSRAVALSAPSRSAIPETRRRVRRSSSCRRPTRGCPACDPSQSAEPTPRARGRGAPSSSRTGVDRHRMRLEGEKHSSRRAHRCNGRPTRLPARRPSRAAAHRRRRAPGYCLR